MFKRNLLIGSLVAGAFVLPSLAMAGVVNGVCSNCHTMHASQDGATVFGGPKADLLKDGSCAGCHANADNNTASGVPTVGLTLAPQVDYNAASFVNAGGYFLAAADNQQHNPGDIANTEDTITNVPGNGALLTVAPLTCQGCHSVPGHHVAGGNYRMLTDAGSTSTSYGTTAVAATFPGTRAAAVTYDAVAMNGVCASCHMNFHDAGATGGANTGAAALSAWTRHPTNITLGAAAGAGIDTAAVETDAVVMGTGKEVMCLSCHVAHGGPYADLLSFDITAVSAGDGTDGTGCEICHSYAAGGY